MQILSTFDALVHRHACIRMYIHTHTSVHAQGMMPSTILDLLVGEALSEASDLRGGNEFRLMGMGLVIVALVVAVMYAASIAKRVLKEAEEVRIHARWLV